MQYKELAPEEQAKIRRTLRDRLPNDLSRLAKLVDGRDRTSIDDPELLSQLRSLWAQHRDVLRADFTLPAGLASIIERDRQEYLAPDEALGPLPDPKATDPGRLVRRIHHQRLTLRYLERLYIYAWKARAKDIRRTQRWNDAEQRMVMEELATDADTDIAADPSDLAGLRAKLRRQRHALRRAHRLIDEQQAELGRITDALVRTAATG